MSAFDCPSCGSDNTQKLSVMYQAGTTTGTSHSNQDAYTWKDGQYYNASGHTVTDEFHQTELAAQHAPPSRCHDSRPTVMAVLMCLLFPVCGLVWYITNETAAAITAAGGMLLILASRVPENHAARWNRTVFPSLWEEWNRKWLCHRCGSAFLPTDPQAHAADEETEIPDEVMEQFIQEFLDEDDNRARSEELGLTEVQLRILLLGGLEKMRDAGEMSDAHYEATADYVRRFPNGPPAKSPAR